MRATATVETLVIVNEKGRGGFHMEINQGEMKDEAYINDHS